jgi:hypothetical protein
MDSFSEENQIEWGKGDGGVEYEQSTLYICRKIE